MMQVRLAQRTDWKHLERNSVVEGRLILHVFAGNDIAITQGTKVELTVESAKKAENSAGRWRKAGDVIVRAFNPLVGAAMSDAAVANTARYFGLGASGVFLVTRHGRDVYLPQYSAIEIDFGRHTEEPAQPQARSSRFSRTVFPRVISLHLQGPA